jgi:hypothetical protein
MPELVVAWCSRWIIEETYVKGYTPFFVAVDFPPDGFVSKDGQWLHFAFDDNRHRAVHYSAKLPPLK